MKKAIGLGLLVGIFFAVFVLLQEYIGASAFYIAALAIAMFAVIGPFGDYLKTAIAMLIGVVVGLVGIVALAAAMPLPPDNLIYVAIVCGLSLFLMVLLSATGMRIDAMFLGWAAIFAALYQTYLTNTTAIATQALPALVGTCVTLLVGMVLSLIIIKIAMAVNK
ncbi:MAG TPA: DUF1097 family protein [Syntrophomonadaceae bacterium]|mgnify:CR=1 FL=1|nr:DUF1097 family protein [Syntrophomonadaceae bacterium]HRX20282.1 DUF1097 family protein [Syntrophomonadaceae bacterium]